MAVWENKPGAVRFKIGENGEERQFSPEMVPDGDADIYFILDSTYPKDVVIFSYCTFNEVTAAKCGMMENKQGTQYVAAR